VSIVVASKWWEELNGVHDVGCARGRLFGPGLFPFATTALALVSGQSRPLALGSCGNCALEYTKDFSYPRRPADLPTAVRSSSSCSYCSQHAICA
jgi:hypothetical protein